MEERETISGVFSSRRKDDVAPGVLVPSTHIIDLVVDHEPGVGGRAVLCYFGPAVLARDQALVGVAGRSLTALTHGCAVVLCSALVVWNSVDRARLRSLLMD